MYNKDSFLGNWQSFEPARTPYGDLVSIFIKWVVDNEYSITERFELASNPATSPGVLAMLAFDKGHHGTPGDIRLAIASNPNTPVDALEMIIGNEDRQDWNWDDWLDYENDDWSDDVDMVAEYGNDISQEVSSLAKSLAQANLEARS
jgi:hypothetical protein